MKSRTGIQSIFILLLTASAINIFGSTRHRSNEMATLQPQESPFDLSGLTREQLDEIDQRITAYKATGNRNPEVGAAFMKEITAWIVEQRTNAMIATINTILARDDERSERVRQIVANTDKLAAGAADFKKKVESSKPPVSPEMVQLESEIKQYKPDHTDLVRRYYEGFNLAFEKVIKPHTKTPSDLQSLLNQQFKGKPLYMMVAFLGNLVNYQLLFGFMEAADVHYLVGDTGMTPLLGASMMGDIEKVKYLLGCQVPLDQKDNEGLTPLHWAAFAGRTDVVTVLLAHNRGIFKSLFGQQLPKVAIDAQDNDGNTPLYKAVEACCLETVQVLLAHGASRTIANKAGRTVQRLCSEKIANHEKGFTAIQQLLEA